MSQSIMCAQDNLILILKFTHVNHFNLKIIRMNEHVIECNFMLSN
jgi:hypothetical protein